MFKHEKMTLAFALVTSLLLSLPAQARLGSSHSYHSSWGGGSSSSYGAYSSRSASSRLGGGAAVGMQRDDVAQKLRYGSSSPAYGAPTATPAPVRRPGWGTVAGAAAAGGLLGYMLGGHAGGYGAYGMMGGGSGMGSLFILLLVLGGIAWWLMRRRTPDFSAREVWAQQQASAASPVSAGSWSEDPHGLFRELQDINTRRDEAALRAACTPALAQDLLPNMGGAAVQILDLQAEVVDSSAGLVSVRYRGTVMEEGAHPETIDELWNFVRNPGRGRPWLLAGIQPL